MDGAAARRGKDEHVVMDRCVVAIDGPSGSGKTTVSRRLATALEAAYLDTGAMYRAVTLAVLRTGADLTDSEGMAKIAVEAELAVGTDPDKPAIALDGEAVDGPIRSPEVTGAVSAVAAVAVVRRLLVARQREIIAGEDRIVVEGRDIGSVVAPEAELKVFLTAEAPERARRRSAEEDGDEEATAAELARRDEADSTRTADPLHRAEGAVELDTTGMDIDEVVAHLAELAREAAR